MTYEIKLPEAIGPYRIKSKLGQGGMGAVFHAVHETLERSVALKILPAELSSDPEYVTRFLREARTVATLRHDNIVQVYDAGSVDGKYFIAMELVDGSTLGKYLQKKVRLSEQEGLELLYQAAQGLAVAHDKGLVHRDIKPDNMLLDKDFKTLRIVDFGLVMEQTSTTQLTATGACLGTPQFMSPEQADGEKADGRADLYSLGVTFYLALTGQPPFSSPTVMNLLFKHKFEAPADPRTHCKELSESACHLILSMMAKRREDRPQAAKDVVKLIEDIRAGKKIPAPPVFVSPLTPKGMQTVSGVTVVTQTVTPSPRPSNLPLMILAGAAAGVCMLIVVGWFIFGRGQNTDALSDKVVPKGAVIEPQDIARNDHLAAIARGDEKMASGDYRAALGAYSLAFKAKPNAPDLQAKLDAAQRKVRRLELVEEAEGLEQVGSSKDALRRYEDAAALGDAEQLQPRMNELKFKVLVQDAQRAEMLGHLDEAQRLAQEANVIRDASALVRSIEFKHCAQRAKVAEAADKLTEAALLYEQASQKASEQRLQDQYKQDAARCRQMVYVQRAKACEERLDWKGASEAYDLAWQLMHDPLLAAKRDENSKKASEDGAYLKALADGDKALADLKLEQAQQHYTRAYGLKPESKLAAEKLQEVAAWRTLERGDEFKRVGNSEQAREEYAKVPGMCVKLRGVANQRILDLVQAQQTTFGIEELEKRVDGLVRDGRTGEAYKAANEVLRKNPQHVQLRAMSDALGRLEACEKTYEGAMAVARKGRSSAQAVLNVDSTSNDGRTIKERLDEQEKEGQGAIGLARNAFISRKFESLSEALHSARTFANETSAALSDAKAKISKKADDAELFGIKVGPFSIGKKDKESARKLRGIAQEFGLQADEARQYGK